MCVCINREGSLHSECSIWCILVHCAWDFTSRDPLFYSLERLTSQASAGAGGSGCPGAYRKEGTLGSNRSSHSFSLICPFTPLPRVSDAIELWAFWTLDWIRWVLGFHHCWLRIQLFRSAKSDNACPSVSQLPTFYFCCLPFIFPVLVGLSVFVCLFTLNLFAVVLVGFRGER